MKLEIKKDSTKVIFIPSGRIDTESYPVFLKNVEENIGNDTNNVIFDFNNVDYLASAGIRVIVFAIKKMAAIQGKFKIINCLDNVRKVFAMVGLENYLDKK